MMGGDIGVDSQVGEGSTFWFTARFDKAVSHSRSNEAGRTFSADTDDHAGSYAGTRILLAEDEPINQEVSRAWLEDVGLTVDLAEDGAAGGGDGAVQRLRADPDGHADADMNGVEATRAIRVIPGLRSTPDSGHDGQCLRRGPPAFALTAGMNDHIGKPVDPELLFAVVLKWLSHERRC